MADLREPGADPWRALRWRAQAMHAIRAHFAATGALEIDPPILQPGANLDPGVVAQAVDTAEGRRWLPTSPEHPLKRLVAAGAGAVWALSPVVRVGERGRRHLPEFRMLEWYRPGWTLDRLIDETIAVLALLSGRTQPVQRTTWRAAFHRHAGIDPHGADPAALHALSRELHLPRPLDDADERELRLDWIWSQRVEPAFAAGAWHVVLAWPAGRAGQARVRRDADGFHAAERFEIVCDGLELANGYDECPDAEELARRFAALAAQQPGAEPDQRLLAAIRAGFPPCAGVAVGFDRVAMLGLGVDDIRKTTAFPDG